MALFGFVTVAAIGCAALANPTVPWAIGVVSAVFATLAFSILAAIYGLGRRRSFWLGFAIVGWGHVLLYVLMNNTGTTLQNYILTYWASTALYQDQSEPVVVGNVVEQLITMGPNYGEKSNILFAILSLGSAFIGGLVARHLYLRRERQVTSKPPG
jgi:hypothetical protein